MSVKIQINSLEALERLIGGDSDLEVQLRQNVAEKFSVKYIKALAHDKLTASFGSKLKDEVISEFFDKSGSWGKTLTLNKRGIEQISSKIDKVFRNELDRKVSEYLKSSEVYEKLQSALDVATTRITDSLADANLERRLDRMVDERLKEKLGLS